MFFAFVLLIFFNRALSQFKEIFTLDCHRNAHVLLDTPFSSGFQLRVPLGIVNFAFNRLHESAKEFCPNLNEADFDSRFSVLEPNGFLRIFKSQDFSTISNACQLRYHNEISVIYNYLEQLLPSQPLPTSCNALTAENGNCHFQLDFDSFQLHFAIDKCNDINNEGYANKIPFVSILCTGCDDFFKPCANNNDCSGNCVYFSDIYKFYKGFYDGDEFDKVYRFLTNRKFFDDLGLYDDINYTQESTEYTPLKISQEFFKFITEKYFSSNLNINDYSDIKMCLPNVDLKDTNFLNLGDISSCNDASYMAEYYCNDVIFTDPSVCSGHGECSYMENGGQCICEDGYSDTICSTVENVILCNGVESTNSDVCSGNGKCINTNECECQDGLMGNCDQILTCNSIMFNDIENVCNGRGRCIRKDYCNCTSAAYYGDLCEHEYSCYDIPGTDPLACSGHGDCIADNVCDCDDSYSGDFCNERTICNKKLSNNPQVCSGHGLCTAENICVCEDGYKGNDCENDIRSCSGIFFSNSTYVCSGHGKCGQHGTTNSWRCVCNDGYSGADCETLVFCNDQESTNPEVCRGRGVCKSNGLCECKYPYKGVDCEDIITCNGIAASDKINVCSGNGICTVDNTCMCDEEHDGVNCEELIKCDGVSADDYENVCDGKFYCTKSGCKPSLSIPWSEGDCNCAKDIWYFPTEWDGKVIDKYTGSEIKVNSNARKDGTYFVETNIHSYTEKYKQYKYNENKPILLVEYDSTSSTLQILPSHKRLGTSMIFTEVNYMLKKLSSLMEKFFENLEMENSAQEYYKFWGLLPWLRRFTEYSHHMKNNEDDFVVKFLSNFELPEWFKRVQTPSTCTFERYLDSGECSFAFTNTYFGSEVTFYISIERSKEFVGSFPSFYLLCDGELCHDIYNIRTCKTNSDCPCGKCQEVMQIDRYNDIETYISSYALYVNPDENVISPFNNEHFRLHYTNELKSENAIEFYNDLIYYITGTSATYKSDKNLMLCSTLEKEKFTSYKEEFEQYIKNVITSQRGHSISIDGLEDWYAYPSLINFYNDKDVITCNGYAHYEKQVCSSHGKCIAHDTCQCNNEYYGDDCDIFSCHSYASNNPLSCSEHGKCYDIDKCTCDMYYSGEYCNETTCFSISNKDKSVCSESGVCKRYDECECYLGYGGEKCEDFECYNYAVNDPNVCSSKGECIGPNECLCTPPYEGKKCEKIMCYELMNDNPNVCSGSGICSEPDNCACLTGYKGNQCQTPQCFGVWADSATEHVCSNHGSCLGYDLCECDDGYAGFNCQHQLCHGKYAILYDNFEKNETLDKNIWNTKRTEAVVTDGGCSSSLGSGRSLYFYGKNVERYAETVLIDVQEGNKESFFLSFLFLMNTGESGCDTAYFSDKVYVNIIYGEPSVGDESENTYTLTTLEPVKYAKKNKKVQIEFVPVGDFRISITQPETYGQAFGQFSIDNFFLSFGDYTEPPCNMNGQCRKGACECFLGDGQECKFTGCVNPVFKDIKPTEGSYKGGTVVEITGCFSSDIEKCRFYSSWRDPGVSSVEGIATLNGDKTLIKCTVPSRVVTGGSDQLKVDVYSSSKGWINVKGYIFNYVDDSNSQMQSGGSIVNYETNGIFWFEDEMNTNDYGNEIDILITFVFIKHWSEWYNCDCSAVQKSTIQRTNVQISQEKYSTSTFVYDKKINPSLLRLYELEVKCVYSSNTAIEAPCYSYSKKKQIDIPTTNAREYCDRFYSNYKENPDYARELPSCPTTLTGVKRLNKVWQVEEDCSSKYEAGKSCTYFFPSAYECYTSIRIGLQQASRRCCYDIYEELIDRSSKDTYGPHSYYCSKGVNDCYYPTESAISHIQTDHYTADLIPCEVCAKELGEEEEFAKRRPVTLSSSFSGSEICGGSGDPHLRSFNGNRFDFFGECTYWLLKPQSGDHLEIQGHYFGSGFSTTTALAFKHKGIAGSPKIQFQSHWGSDAPKLLLDDVVVDAKSNPTIVGCTLSSDNNGRWTFKYDTGEVVQFLSTRSNSMFSSYQIYGVNSENYFENTEGLCGYWCGDRQRDLLFQFSSGTGSSRYADLSDKKDVHEFGYSYGVHPNENFFKFEDGDARVCKNGGMGKHFNISKLPKTIDELYTNKTKLKEMVELCKMFAPGSVDDCLFDIFYLEEVDRVLEESALTESTYGSISRGSVSRPSLIFFKEGSQSEDELEGSNVEYYTMRRGEHDENCINFEIKGGDKFLREDFTIRIGKFSLWEDFDLQTVFNNSLISLFDIVIDINNKKIKVFFESSSLTNKMYALELLIGDDLHGYSSFIVKFICKCESGKSGLDCNEIGCFDYPISNEFVCSSHGDCIGENICECHEGYIGDNCQYGFKLSSYPIVQIVSDSSSSWNSVIDDFYFNTYEKIVLKSKIYKINGCHYEYIGDERDSDKPIYYKWSLLNGEDIDNNMLLTPANQKDIAIKPYAFEPYTEHSFLLQVYFDRERAIKPLNITQKIYIINDLPSEHIGIVRKTANNNPNEYTIDCSSYKFGSKYYTISYNSDANECNDENEVVLMVTSDNVFDIRIPVMGKVKLKVKIFHELTKREIIIMNDVIVNKVSIYNNEIDSYIKEHSLFNNEDTFKKQNHLYYLSYFINYLNTFNSNNNENAIKMSEYRYEVLSSLMGTKIDNKNMPLFISILKSLIKNKQMFPSNTDDNDSVLLFENTICQILSQFSYYYNKEIDFAYEKLLFSMYKDLFTDVIGEDNDDDAVHSTYVLSLFESFLSSLNHFSSGKINGEIIELGSKVKSFESYSIKQKLYKLESFKKQFYSENYRSLASFEFPPYIETENNDDLLVTINKFNVNPYKGHKSKVHSDVLKVNIKGECSDKYIIKFNGFFGTSEINYYNEVTNKWEETGTFWGRRSIRRRILLNSNDNTYVKVIEHNKTNVIIESNVRNIAFGMFERTINPVYVIIIILSIIFCIVIICVPIVIIVMVFVCYYVEKERKKEKIEKYKKIRKDIEIELLKKERKEGLPTTGRKYLKGQNGSYMEIIESDDEGEEREEKKVKKFVKVSEVLKKLGEDENEISGNMSMDMNFRVVKKERKNKVDSKKIKRYQNYSKVIGEIRDHKREDGDGKEEGVKEEVVKGKKNEKRDTVEKTKEEFGNVLEEWKNKYKK